MFKSKLVQTLWRTLIATLTFGIPVLFAAHPEWQNITVGAIVFGVLHYAEKYYVSA